jgi:hypothetical protein
VNRLYLLGGEPSRGEGTDQPPVEDADKRSHTPTRWAGFCATPSRAMAGH